MPTPLIASWLNVFVLLMVCAVVGLSQDLGLLNNLPLCGKACIGSFSDDAATYSYDPSDYFCLCDTKTFVGDVSRCALQSCQGDFDAKITVTNLGEYCDQAKGNQSIATSSQATSAGRLTKTTFITETPTQIQFKTIPRPSSATTHSVSGSPSSGTASAVPSSIQDVPNTPLQTAPATHTTAAPMTMLQTTRLSTSQNIGIGLGVPLGALLGFAFALFLFRNHRRQRKSSLNRANAPENAPAENAGTLLPTNDTINGGEAIKEEGLSSSGPAELHSTPIELHSRELAGTPTDNGSRPLSSAVTTSPQESPMRSCAAVHSHSPLNHAIRPSSPEMEGSPISPMTSPLSPETTIPLGEAARLWSSGAVTRQELPARESAVEIDETSLKRIETVEGDAGHLGILKKA